MFIKKYNFIIILVFNKQSLLGLGSYLKPIAACHTNASNKKKTGTIGNTSTIGLNAIYASGNRANNKLSIRKTSICIKISNVKYSKFNNINFTIKIKKILIYINDIF